MKILAAVVVSLTVALPTTGVTVSPSAQAPGVAGSVETDTGPMPAASPAEEVGWAFGTRSCVRTATAPTSLSSCEQTCWIVWARCTRRCFNYEPGQQQYQCEDACDDNLDSCLGNC